MTQTIVMTHEPLDRLADAIRADVERREHGREAWIVATLDLCQHLAEARALFPAHIQFGRWCDAQAFGLNADDQGAAIQMGQHIEDARAVLMQTESRSLRLIEKNEFRSRIAARTPELNPPTDQPAPPKAAKPKKPKPPPRPSKITDDMRERIAAGLTAGGGQQEVADEVGAAIGKPVSRIDVRLVQAELNGGLLSGAPDRETLSLNRQADLDRALRKARVALRVEITAEVKAEIGRIYDEIILPEVNRKNERAERIIAAHKGLMPRTAYRLILACLHPDNADEARKARFAEAFQVFRDLEPVLVKSDSPPLRSGSLPQTLGELRAARRKSS